MVEVTAATLVAVPAVVDGAVSRRAMLLVAAVDTLAWAMLRVVVLVAAPPRAARVGAQAEGVAGAAVAPWQVDVGGAVAGPVPALRAPEVAPLLPVVAAPEVPRCGLDVAAALAAV